MSGEAQNTDEIQQMADEVARLMVDRFGGARRGTMPRLQEMLRRRGAALPRKLRRQAAGLAEADRISAQPKVARQLDMTALTKSHQALVQHLRPLGRGGRWQRHILNLTATVVFGLLVLGAVVIWLMVRRGHL